MTQGRPTADGEAVPERPLEEIQAVIGAAAGPLETLVGELGPLLRDLERRHFPEADELERMGTGEQCPSVAFEVHGDLADVLEALCEALDGVRKAAGRTVETVRAGWRERLLAKVEDEPTRQVLREIWR